jgi:hypothetical protein
VTVTVTPPACPCSLFPTTDVPGTPNSQDPNAVEVGLRFTTDVPGAVTGVSFYKGSSNTGTHIGNLWTSTGSQLATGTFTNETASGWQTLTFAAPVPIQPGTTYVASYHTTAGFYSSDPGFYTRPVDSWPLHAPAGFNGVFAYGGTQFPTQTFSANNYWVDVVFESPATMTALAVAPGPSVAGQPVTLTATVSGFGAPGGTVAFIDGTQQIGTAMLSGGSPDQAVFSTSALAVGDHSLSAAYAGGAGFAGSTSLAVTQHVGQASTVAALTAGPSPSVYGRPVTLTAIVVAVGPGAGTPTGTVVFSDGSTPLGSAPLSAASGSDQASVTTSALGAGSHAITAAYQGDSSFAGSTSPAVPVTVQRAATALVAVPAPLSPLTVSATLTRADDGTPLAGQIVQFAARGAAICSGTTNGSGIASCDGSGAALAIILNGGYTASFDGTVNLAPSTAAATVLTGGVTAVPVVSLSTPWFNEEQVRVTNTTNVTSLSITVVVQRTAGIVFNGQYNTVSGQTVQSHTNAPAAVAFRWSLGAGQTLAPGTAWTFAAQTNGTGSTHPTAGDTWTVTYSTGGVTYTQSGHF